jgi:hypothetical protein
MAVLRVKTTRAQSIRESATPDEMPPLFTNNVTTRALAILYHHGAMGMSNLSEVRPTLRTKDIWIGLRPLIEARPTYEGSGPANGGRHSEPQRKA